MTNPPPSQSTWHILAAPSAWLDAFILAAVGVTLLVAAVYLDLGEAVSEWMQAYEAWELDELTFVLDVLFIGLAWFALRRWREAVREIRKREATSQELARRAAEKSEGEERLRLALEAGRVIAWERDLETGLMTRSPNAADITGIVQGSADAFNRRVHPDDRLHHDRAVSLALSEGIPYAVELRFLRDDGRTIWLQTRAQVRTRSDGRRILVGTNTDITAQKLAEINLQHSEERLRLATEAAGLGTYIIDLRTGVRQWSQGMRALLGLSPDAQSGREAYNQLLHPDDREQAEADFNLRMGQTTEPVEARYRIVRADTGEVRWISELSRALTDESGQPARLVGTLRDITREKEAELALRESEERYRLLAENATDVIFRTSLDGKRLYLSPSCRTVYGYSPEELLGTDATDLVHPDDIPGVKADLGATMAGQPGHETSVYRIRHKAGHWVWLEARRWLVRDENGLPVEIAGIVRDISERRKLEEQLRQSQKMEVVGQLTGGIAHDFNNLLTVVIGNIEMLAERITDPKHKALALMVQEAAERGASLTQHLLAFGRRQTLRPERLDLSEVVRGLAPLLRRTMGEHIELATELGPGDPVAVADRTLLENAILNLVVNARDAMPQGGTLTLKTGERSAYSGEGQLPTGQPVVYVTVSDTGSGMLPEVVERAFEPFFTTKEVGKGSGLGLSMVYGFAEQSGGHALIESEEGRGTSVTILLRSVSTSTGEVTVRGAEPDVKGVERVLVVEDDEQVREYVCAQLRSLGYEVTAVEAGPEALDRLRQRRDVDLLFTDVVLPKGMSGVELAKRARALKPDLKVLLTSGYPEDTFEHHGRPEVGTVLLRKPYRGKELAETLRKVLD